MKRYLLFGVAIIFAIASAAVLFPVLKKPGENESRLARGRAQLETENYLAALQTLRNVADSKKNSPEVHSYLGAAYLRLHL